VSKESERSPAKFKVGDPVIRNGPEVHFISDVMWNNQRGWIYEITYSQTNMCSLTRWQGGGSSFWWDEESLASPTGEAKLLGELWRQLRIEQGLNGQLELCRSTAEHLRFSLALISASTERSALE